MYTVRFQVVAPRCGPLRLPCSERYVHLVAVLGTCIKYIAYRQERQYSAQVIWIWEFSGTRPWYSTYLRGIDQLGRGLIDAPMHTVRTRPHAAVVARAGVSLAGFVGRVYFEHFRRPAELFTHTLEAARSVAADRAGSGYDAWDRRAAAPPARSSLRSRPAKAEVTQLYCRLCMPPYASHTDIQPRRATAASTAAVLLAAVDTSSPCAGCLQSGTA
eukprot:COSAG02_NODE_1350_length_13120_cov_4.275555_1_plen_216_part_00